MLIKPKKDIDMRGIVDSLTNYGKWRTDRISALPGDFILLPEQRIELPLEEQEKIGRLGLALNKFFEAGDILYRNCPEIRQLIRLGKPDWWREVEENLLSTPQNTVPFLYRPDIIVTKDGIKITELEIAVEGLGFQAVWNEVYHQDEAPLSLKKIATNVSNRFIVLDLSLDKSIAENQIIVEWLKKRGNNAKILSMQDGLKEIQKKDVVLRPFNLARWTNDICFSASEAIKISLRDDILLLNPTSWFEEKVWLGILWHPRYESFLRSSGLGEDLDFLKDVIPQTWILHPDFLEEKTLRYWLSLADREKRFVSKLSGFNLNAWGARSVVFWDEKTDADWQMFLKNQMQKKPDDELYIIQEYYQPLKSTIWVANLKKDPPLQEKKGLMTKICPFYWRDEHIGSLGMLRNNKKIHGASDTVLAPVNL